MNVNNTYIAQIFDELIDNGSYITLENKIADLRSEDQLNIIIRLMVNKDYMKDNKDKFIKTIKDSNKNKRVSKLLIESAILLNKPFFI